MQQAMQKEGRTGYQMAYSARDLEWLLKNGWQPVVAPRVEVEPTPEPEKRKPGRPKLTLKKP